MPLATLQTAASTCHDSGTGHFELDAFAVVGFAPPRCGALQPPSQRGGSIVVQTVRYIRYAYPMRGANPRYNTPRGLSRLPVGFRASIILAVSHAKFCHLMGRSLENRIT